MTARPAVAAAPKRRWAALPNAATYLDCSVDTIRRYISQGYLPGHRTPNGKTIRVDLNEVDAMMRTIPSGGQRWSA